MFVYVCACFAVALCIIVPWWPCSVFASWCLEECVSAVCTWICASVGVTVHKLISLHICHISVHIYISEDVYMGVILWVCLGLYDYSLYPFSNID